MKTIAKRSNICTGCGQKKNSRHQARQIFHIKTDCVKKPSFQLNLKAKIQDRYNCVYLCRDCGGEKRYKDMDK